MTKNIHEDKKMEKTENVWDAGDFLECKTVFRPRCTAALLVTRWPPRPYLQRSQAKVRTQFRTQFHKLEYVYGG